MNELTSVAVSINKIVWELTSAQFSKWNGLGRINLHAINLLIRQNCLRNFSKNVYFANWKNIHLNKMFSRRNWQRRLGYREISTASSSGNWLENISWIQFLFSVIPNHQFVRESSFQFYFSITIIHLRMPLSARFGPFSLRVVFNVRSFELEEMFCWASSEIVWYFLFNELSHWWHFKVIQWRIWMES